MRQRAAAYDKAMDAEYLRTAIGGGNRRMFDGGHDLAGAWEAVRNTSPDDTFIEEALGYVEALFKDLTAPKGLPIASWDKSAYDQIANGLQSNFGIPCEPRNEERQRGSVAAVAHGTNHKRGRSTETVRKGSFASIGGSVKLDYN